MKPLVIYHANCADGFGAAFAAWLKLGDEAEYVPFQYGQDFNDLPAIDGREVYILDFSFSIDIMGYLFNQAKRVVWLDHHKTAFEMWCGKAPDLFFTMHTEHCDRKHILLDDLKSGAVLAWEFFHPGTEVPMLIQHIDDYDRWQFKIEGTKELNKALWAAQSWNFPQWKELIESDIRPMYKAGKAILRAHNQNVQSVVKGSARACAINHPEGEDWAHTYWPWVNGLAANCPPHLTSDVGHELAVMSGTFGLCWTLSQTGLMAKCSLRSNGDYDVSTIAKAFGGGGHRNAAGFEVTIGKLLSWLEP